LRRYSPFALGRVGIDTAKWPNITAFMDRVGTG
jgi:hypothetical protein